LLAAFECKFSCVDIRFSALRTHSLAPARNTSYLGLPSCAIFLRHLYTSSSCPLLRNVSRPASLFALPLSQSTLYSLAQNTRLLALPRAQFLYKSSALVGIVRCFKIQALPRRYSLFRPRGSLSCSPHGTPCFPVLSHAQPIRDGQVSVWIAYCSKA
jgi:hypothetical protein